MGGRREGAGGGEGTFCFSRVMRKIFRSMCVSIHPLEDRIFFRKCVKKRKMPVKKKAKR